ncbi:MAG: prolyl oligopeptidase family serine peptidase [Myxococcota bacterium]
MRCALLLLLAPLALHGCATTTPKTESQAMNEIETRRDDVKDTLHGTVVADPYRWLEDPSQEEVAAWMGKQDDFARSRLAGYPGRAAAEERLEALLYVDSQSVPSVKGGRAFFWRKPKDQEKSILMWSEGPDAEPKVLLDPNTMSEDGSLSITDAVASKDGKLLAYMEQPNNMDESTLRVMRVDDGSLLPDTIEGLRYTAPSWTPDGRGFFYTWIPPASDAIPNNERMAYGEIRFHRLGTDPAQDETLRERTGSAERWMSAGVSEDGRWVFMSISHGWAESDLYVRPLKDEMKGTEWIQLGAEGVQALYQADAWNGRWLIATNERDPNWEVYAVDPAKPDRDDWTLIVAARPERVIAGMQIVDGRIILHALESASSRLEVRSLDGTMERELTLPGLGSVGAMSGRADDPTLYFDFGSFNRPNEIHQVNVATGEGGLLSRPDVPLDPDDLVVEQKFYTSKDGTKVSMFIVRRPDVELDGSHPTLLYGYGGFNISLTPRFSVLATTWVEQGGIYAQPNLRGGGKYGEAWHKAGMLSNKQNVFDDFIAAAEWLVGSGYTSSEHLAIRGRSNGGLLVGAAMTQRPDLYAAVICGVPLLDMVRYHKFGIGQAWIPEYGSAEDPEQFEVLLAYSPYHNVREGTDYPPLLMLSADSDDRVDPMHARKFVAAVAAARSDPEPTLLRIEENSGHGGGDLRRQAVAQLVDEISFLRAHL